MEALVALDGLAGFAKLVFYTRPTLTFDDEQELNIMRKLMKAGVKRIAEMYDHPLRGRWLDLTPGIHLDYFVVRTAESFEAIHMDHVYSIRVFHLDDQFETEFHYLGVNGPRFYRYDNEGNAFVYNHFVTLSIQDVFDRPIALI